MKDISLSINKFNSPWAAGWRVWVGNRKWVAALALLEGIAKHPGVRTDGNPYFDMSCSAPCTLPCDKIWRFYKKQGTFFSHYVVSLDLAKLHKFRLSSKYVAKLAHAFTKS